MTIGVIGDGFTDRYWVGRVRGQSAEAPIPIVDIEGKKDFPGGARNVAANLTSLGADCFYLERIQQNYPTKNRLLTESGLQLARWDEDDWCRPYERADLVELVDADAIVVSDYAKGSVNEEVIQILRNFTGQVFVDTKRDPGAWIGSNAILFPNLKEYEQYKQKYDWFPQVVLKRGPEGLAWMEYGHITFQRASRANYVVSVNGAGDSVLAGFVRAYTEGWGIMAALEFANEVAGVAVEKPFTSTVNLSEVGEWNAKSTN
jgi:D-beta-D-heptose 7-phosphate kinase/D-beta-D-heptose 1-phosphate adenosyltransferase